MEAWEILRNHLVEMRAYIQKRGFSPDYGTDGGCRCYIGVHESMVKRMPVSAPANDVIELLRKLVAPDKPFGAFAASRLLDHTTEQAIAILTTAIAMLPQRGAETPRVTDSGLVRDSTLNDAMETHFS